MAINRRFFFDHLHEKLYPVGLHQSQVDGHEAVLNAWETGAVAGDDRWLAYMLGTAYHETAKTLQPVRETLAANDKQAAARLEDAWQKGHLPWVTNPYWHPDSEGKYWFGRGLVQLTHKTNYRKLGDLIHEDLLTDPGNALDMSIAIKVMFEGMAAGSFTGKKLSDYFSSTVEDWRGARRIINGTESNVLVADNARSYYAALSHTS
jgi:glycosyl hydrolase family 19 (putative chitinase)